MKCWNFLCEGFNRSFFNIRLKNLRPLQPPKKKLLHASVEISFFLQTQTFFPFRLVCTQNFSLFFHKSYYMRIKFIFTLQFSFNLRSWIYKKIDFNSRKFSFSLSSIGLWKQKCEKKAFKESVYEKTTKKITY